MNSIACDLLLCSEPAAYVRVCAPAREFLHYLCDCHWQRLHKQQPNLSACYALIHAPSDFPTSALSDPVRSPGAALVQKLHAKRYMIQRLSASEEALTGPESRYGSSALARRRNRNVRRYTSTHRETATHAVPVAVQEMFCNQSQASPPFAYRPCPLVAPQSIRSCSHPESPGF